MGRYAKILKICYYFIMKLDNNELLEKIAETFEKYCRICKSKQWESIKKLNISPIQMKFLIYLKKKEKKYCNVSNISKEFALKPPTVSDAISSLLKKGLVKEEKTTKDKRIKFFQITKKSLKIENKLKNWNKCLKDSIELLTFEEKKNLLNLLKILIFMQKLDYLPEFQLCLTCNYYKTSNGKAYCGLTRKKIKPIDIKYNCRDYERKDFRLKWTKMMS